MKIKLTEQLCIRTLQKTIDSLQDKYKIDNKEIEFILKKSINEIKKELDNAINK